jgi:hypothetical protein
METPLGWSVLVTAVHCPAREVGRLLARFRCEHPAVRHLACYVLWDRLGLAADLGALGFRATAYLPGWYLRDGLRHDCLMLTWLARGETTIDNGLAVQLRPMQEALGDLTGSRECPQTRCAGGSNQAAVADIEAAQCASV